MAKTKKKQKTKARTSPALVTGDPGQASDANEEQDTSTEDESEDDEDASEHDESDNDAAAAAPANGAGGEATTKIVESRTTKRLVMVQLSDAEKARMGVEMGETEIAIEQKKAEAAVINEARRKLEGHRNALGHALEAGAQEREILCDLIEDFAQKVVRTIRRDNGEQVEERTMTAHELQGQLGFTKPTAVEEPDADPAPDSSLRTLAEEQADGEPVEDVEIEMDDTFDADDEAGEGAQLDA